MEVSGIIIDVIILKEHDAMVRLLTSDGLISFFARRVMDQKSVNYSALQPFSYGKYSINEGPQKGLSLNHAQLISYLGFDYTTLDQHALLGLIKETLVHISIDQEEADIYALVMDVVNAGKNSSKGRIVTAVYLQRLLSLLGWGLHLEGCVVCGSKKDIVGLDLSAGGFICRRHINESTTTLLPAVELHAIRQISLISFAELEHVSIDNKVMVAIIKLLGSHYENMTDQQLKSVQLFIN